jgi:hypothetical protein
MQQTTDQAQYVWRASNPGLDVDINEVFIPLHEIPEMSHMEYITFVYAVEVEEKTDCDHGDEGSIACSPVLEVEEDEEHGKYEDLHIVLQIPAPAHAHLLSVVYQVVHEQNGLPSSLAVGNLTNQVVLLP